MDKQKIINEIIILLRSTTTKDITSSEADKIVSACANILEYINNQ